ncbi:hypothetical protein MMC17_004750 [Xylographa soralifera]|nr:hypothetical protein [Xylographa soralifera]
MVDDREGKRRGRRGTPPTPGVGEASGSNSNNRRKGPAIRNGCIQDEAILGRWGFLDGHQFVPLYPDMFDDCPSTTCHNICLGTLYNDEDSNGARSASQRTPGLSGRKKSKRNQRRTKSSIDVEEYSIISDTFLEVDEILTHIALSHRLRELAELTEQYQAFSALCTARINQTDQVPTRGKVWDKVHLAFVKRIREILQSFEKNRIIQDILHAAKFMTGPRAADKSKFWKEDKTGCCLDASRYLALSPRMDRNKKRGKVNSFIKELEKSLPDAYPRVNRDMDSRRIQLSAVVESGIDAAAKAVGPLPLGSLRR